MQILLELSKNIQSEWRKSAVESRLSFLPQLAITLLKNKQEYAECITKEMHKPITQAIAEVEKCALLCTYYYENAAQFLATKHIKTDASESFVTYEPLGVILGVMPWNFPFWQVFRFAVPSLIAGNTVLVKHASNVPKSAKLIQTIFETAGFPKGCYQDLPISSSEVAKIIAKNSKCPLVLGSATPDINTYYNAKNGEIELFKDEVKIRKSEKGMILNLKEEDIPQEVENDFINKVFELFKQKNKDSIVTISAIEEQEEESTYVYANDGRTYVQGSLF